MIKFVEMDETTMLRDQFAEADGPVILINKFNVKPEDVDRLLQVWADDAAYFKRQPGFISTQLYRGTGRSCVFINHAVWESVAHFRQAFDNPEFRVHLSAYPDSVVASPHLFRKVAAPGICLGC